MSISIIKNVPIRSICRVILPITLISSSVILRRNKKLNKKHRRMIRILQISILIIFISQNLPFFIALVEMFIYYTNPSPYKDLNHFDFELPSEYIEEIENMERESPVVFIREDSNSDSTFSSKLYRFLYRFIMKGGSRRLFIQTIRGSGRLVKWLIQSGNF